MAVSLKTSSILAEGTRPVGRPKLGASGLNAGTWEALASDRCGHAQSTLSWRTAHYSGSGGEKSEKEGRLQDFNNLTRGTVHLPELIEVLSANLTLDCLAKANAAPSSNNLHSALYLWTLPDRCLLPKKTDIYIIERVCRLSRSVFNQKSSFVLPLS